MDIKRNKSKEDRILERLKKTSAYSSIQELDLSYLTEINSDLNLWLYGVYNLHNIGSWDNYLSYSDRTSDILDQIRVLDLTPYELSLFIVEVSNTISELLALKVN